MNAPTPSAHERYPGGDAAFILGVCLILLGPLLVLVSCIGYAGEEAEGLAILAWSLGLALMGAISRTAGDGPVWAWELPFYLALMLIVTGGHLAAGLYFATAHYTQPAIREFGFGSHLGAAVWCLAVSPMGFLAANRLAGRLRQLSKGH
ncbi:MAG: hypothetical protein M5U26_06060 [Planctomycetota bacterium]|nr:hypothetical protein [Planctomycetota bacterium]